MKKIILAIASFALAGCSLYEPEAKFNDTSAVRNAYSATLEDQETKVYATPELLLRWNAGDEISIFSTTKNLRYRFDGETGDREGTFTLQDQASEGTALPATLAIYPYRESTSVSPEGVLSLNLPSVQFYADDSFGAGAVTMLAISDNETSGNLYFKSLCGYVSVRLYGDVTVQSITLKGNSGEKLSGPAMVSPLSGQGNVLSMSDSASDYITLDCGEGVALGRTAEEATTFWFAVPPITFANGFTITVTDIEQRTLTKTMGVSRTVVRNVRNTLTPIRFTPISIIFEEADLAAMPVNAARTIHFTIASDHKNIHMEVIPSDDIVLTDALVIDDKYGFIEIHTGPIIHDDSHVVALFSDGTQTVAHILHIEEEAIKVEENTTKTVGEQGGEVTLEFFSNVPCRATIPEDAQQWISLIPETKGMTKQTVKLAIQPNTGLARSASIQITGSDQYSTISLTYNIIQSSSSIWVDETIPPDNEVWYLTEDNTLCNQFDLMDFGSPVISHSYNNGKGVVRCADAINRVSPAGGINQLERERIKAVVLPETVRLIGQSAFQFFGISSFRTPRDLESVGIWAFISTPLCRFSGSHASADGHLLVIDRIAYASAMHGLEQYTFPSGIECIFDTACQGQHDLKSIVLPDGLKSIGQDAFSYCTALEGNIDIPDSVESIGYLAFHLDDQIDGFTGNAKFHTPDNRCLIVDNVIQKFAGKNLEEYAIPEGITRIEHYGMSGAPKLRRVIFPSTFTSLSGHAFLHNATEGSINIEEFGGYYTTADGKAFVKDGVLETVVPKMPSFYRIPDEVKAIGANAFSSNPSIETIVCHDDISEIGSYAFSFSRNLKSLTLPGHLQRISGYNPIIGCSGLETLYFRSFIPPGYSDSQFDINDCSSLTVYVPEETLELYRRSGWKQYAPYMVGRHYDDNGEWRPEELDYYISSDFSADGKTETLQLASQGTGIDIILMGDGFSDRQIAAGTYGQAMRRAAEAFFNEEPCKSMRDYFNVYSVNVVSTTEGYEHNGQALGTGHEYGTYVYGNDGTVISYAKKAISEDRMDNAVIIVIMNEDTYAGTCFMYDTSSGDHGSGLSIAYCTNHSDDFTFYGIIAHEAAGHGFAKLGDEYVNMDMPPITEETIIYHKNQAAYGWWKNVDFTDNPTTVKWNMFIADERYAEEGIGVYEGGLLYPTGVWRPSMTSIMRTNTDGFNAPSRQAIWYRINKLAYGENWKGTYEDFVAFDKAHPSPEAIVRRKTHRNNRVELRSPLAPPVVIKQ